MTNTPPVSHQDIRRRAEELFRANESIITELTSPEEMKQILYELRVHQIELEMQNEELRRTHEELDASQARYFDLYDLAPVGYLTLSDKKIIQEVNLAAATMFGVVRSKLLKEPISRIIPKDDQYNFYQHLNQRTESVTLQEWEMRLARADGSLFWAHLQATPAENGECWITLNDITDRKQAEQKMQRLTNLYAALSECSKAMVHCKSEEELFQKICFDAVRFGGMHMVWVGLTDLETGLIRVVASAGSGIEYLQNIEISVDADNPFGRGPTGIAIREKRPFWCQDFQNDPTTDPWHERGLRFGLKASASLPLCRAGVAVGALTLYSGEIDAFDEAACSLLVDMAADISYALDNIAREADLRLNERRMSCLFEISQHPFTNEQEFLDHSLNEVITLTSSSIGYIYFYNEQKRQFTLNSWSSEVMKECTVRNQETIYDLDSTGIWGEAVRQRQPILLNDFQARNSLRKGIPEGHVTLLRFLTIPVLIDGVIVAVVGVANKESDYGDADIMQLTLFMDSVWKIAAKKRAEAEKDKLEIQLQQAQKMESVGRLAGGVAHDFNNLLTVILGGAYLALMELDPSQPLHEHITSIQKAAEKSADLTRQLLAFARKQTILPKVLDLNETVKNMINMLQRLIGEDIELKWQPEADLWPIKADPSQIDQILANLCVNSRDSITDIGKITIRTGNSIVDEGYRAEHAYLTPGEYVHISVCDNGCGMDKETQTKIFEPFFTTKGAGRGTGLGLATVYGAVKQNNGFINVYSEPGMGTTFTIHLPRYVDNNDQTPLKGRAQPAPRGLETILLVEDELSILKMTTKILTKQGYTVLVANSPAEAVRLAGEQSGKIDLLITDVVMPDMNGKDLANNLMSLYPKLKCLFMSGYTAEVIARHGVLDDGVHFIQKPFSLPALAIKVRKVLDGES
jgi:PAS domain S-box-containing protein